MSKGDFLFTSESVSQAHPDKVADTISDTILDALLEQDSNSRVACETIVNTGLCLVTGEITTNAKVDYVELVRNTICEIGYDKDKYGFNGRTCSVLIALDKQSQDISIGVTKGEGKHKEQGAGDQGMMFGYACNETDAYMPLPIHLAHKMMIKIAEVRKSGEMKWLRPDSKGQITVEYKAGKPYKVTTVVLSTQHDESVCLDNGKGNLTEEARDEIKEKIINPIIPKEFIKEEIQYHINPTGRFVIGGPLGDSGLTGRKIIVDTYGGMGRHGGGCFSGKDPSKVDRSAAYYARYIAKNLVAAGIADCCEVQLAYAIGIADPVSISVNTFGMGKIEEDKIVNIIKEHFEMRPAQIIKNLNLRRPIYRKTAAYGHFGRDDEDFTWEKIDKIDVLRKAAGL